MVKNYDMSFSNLKKCCSVRHGNRVVTVPVLRWAASHHTGVNCHLRTALALHDVFVWNQIHFHVLLFFLNHNGGNVFPHTTYCNRKWKLNLWRTYYWHFKKNKNSSFPWWVHTEICFMNFQSWVTGLLCTWWAQQPCKYWLNVCYV